LARICTPNTCASDSSCSGPNSLRQTGVSSCSD